MQVATQRDQVVGVRGEKAGDIHNPPRISG
jgi:hypothetical protein